MLKCKITLTEEQVVEIIRDNVEKQFPKTCTSCGFEFGSLKEYLQNTVHQGKPHSYDAELKNWRPARPVGTYSFSGCKCGNTLTLGSASMRVTTMWGLLMWARDEIKRRNISMGDLLNEIREKVDQQALSE